MPLVCTGGLMFLNFQGIPTDMDLQTYPSVHLTSPLEWDPSVLDYVHPDDNGEPDWINDRTEKFNLIQTLMNLMIKSINHSLLHTKFHQLITYWLINIGLPHNGEKPLISFL